MANYIHYHPRYINGRPRNEPIKLMEDELESMRMITRAYWYAMLLHLWHTYGNGGEVLTWVYRRIQEEWARVMRLYLECDDRKDGMVDKTMRGEIRAIEKIGVKL